MFIIVVFTLTPILNKKKNGHYLCLCPTGLSSPIDSTVSTHINDGQEMAQCAAATNPGKTVREP